MPWHHMLVRLLFQEQILHLICLDHLPLLSNPFGEIWLVCNFKPSFIIIIIAYVPYWTNMVCSRNVTLCTNYGLFPQMACLNAAFIWSHPLLLTCPVHVCIRMNIIMGIIGHCDYCISYLGIPATGLFSVQIVLQFPPFGLPQVLHKLFLQSII